MTDQAKRYWLEAGTVLHFVKQPNKPHVARYGQFTSSQEIVLADEHDREVAGLEQAVRYARHDRDHEYKQRLQLEQRLQAVTAELEGLCAFKRSVDEALNSGDGVYRP